MIGVFEYDEDRSLFMATAHLRGIFKTKKEAEEYVENWKLNENGIVEIERLEIHGNNLSVVISGDRPVVFPSKYKQNYEIK